MRNSLQYGSNSAIFSSHFCECLQSTPDTKFGRSNIDVPLLISKSVIVCHLSMATRQPSPTRLQLRSMTSRLRSPSNALRTDSNRSRENEPEGNKKEVIMTYSTHQLTASTNL